MAALVTDPGPGRLPGELAGWPMVCPTCGGPLVGVAPRESVPTVRRVSCRLCRRRYLRRHGVWDFLSPGRRRTLERFMAEYRTVRRSEGRGAGASASLRRLPYPAAGHPRSWEWRVRAASFEALVRSVLDPGPSLRVLDLGAGNGWLSHRLWRLGHRPAAVDISADPTDGLAACRAYDEGAGHPVFPRLRADFACLPVAGGAADVAVFNASLHYSPDHEAALAEALRAVRPGGAVVIVDSPFYRNRAAGELMVAERRGQYRRQFGFPSDAHGGREYLTWGELPSLGQRLGVEWTVVRPHYGLRYAARPWMARLRGRRPPSAFAVIVGRR